MADGIEARQVESQSSNDSDNRKVLTLQQAWTSFNHLTESEVSYGFIAQMAGCSVAEVRQYFTGKRRSRNATQPLSPASTLSSPPEFISESEFTELSETLISSATNKTKNMKGLRQGSRKANVRSLSSITDGSSISSQNDSLVKDELANDDVELDQQRSSKRRCRKKKLTGGKRKKVSSNDGEVPKGFKRQRSDQSPIFVREIHGKTHLQEKRCINIAYKHFERCVSCIAKQTDLCRFLNFRLFGMEDEDEDFVYGPTFKSITGPNFMGEHEKVEASRDQQIYILDMIAPTYNKILKKELPHFENAKTRKIPNLEVTQLCDACETAIFSGYWMCCVCGREICLICYDEWDDEKDKRIKCRCSYARTHTKEQMVPIYHYTYEEITRLIKETEKVMANHDNDEPEFEDDHELPDPVQPPAPDQPDAQHPGPEQSTTEHLKISHPSSDNVQRPDPEQIAVTDPEDSHLSSNDVQGEFYTSRSEPQPRVVNFEVEGDSHQECASKFVINIEPADTTFLELLALNETNTESQLPDGQDGTSAKSFSQKLPDHEGCEAPLPTVISDIPASRPHDRTPQRHDDHQNVVWDVNDLTKEIFQGFWKEGYPILVKKSEKVLSSRLWSPKYFKEKYGYVECETVDCNTGCVYETDVKVFFDGFQDVEKRFSVKGNHPCLKLKDWPSTDDFADMFPGHFNDFMDALPFKEYTTRNGAINLAHRLPVDVNRPDLGPKMYNAYGSNDDEHGIGTTNLHLDMTDAVNMMAYAPKAEDRLEVEKDAPAAAVWDIYYHRDLPRVRRFLRKIANESRLLIDHPIHDQCFYLNSVLRERLFKEEGVSGWRIYQNPGDIVFVPAGCAHQVCNYTSCIKVAVDFVSPEGVGRSYTVNKQFRNLSRGHKRRRDILQLPSILHHSWLTAHES